MTGVLPSREFLTVSRLYGLAPCPTQPPEGTRCRCGTRLGVGTSCYHFERVPRVVAGLLDGQRFCGVACARTFILEALEMFDSSVAPSVLTEAEAMRIALRYLLTVMAVQGGPASQGRPS